MTISPVSFKRDGPIKRSKFSEEPILREVESGRPPAYVGWQSAVSEATFYRWKKKQSGELPSRLCAGRDHSQHVVLPVPSARRVVVADAYPRTRAGAPALRLHANLDSAATGVLAQHSEAATGCTDWRRCRCGRDRAAQEALPLHRGVVPASTCPDRHWSMVFVHDQVARAVRSGSSPRSMNGVASACGCWPACR